VVLVKIRENWRIVLLVVLIALSAFVLFVPSGGASTPENGTVAGGDPTNLEYGLELSGGTRVRAQLNGLTATGLSFTGEDISSIRQTVAEETGLDPFDVNVQLTAQNQGTVELYTETVSESAFVEALNAAGLDASAGDVREGVTSQTLGTAQQVLDRRINAGGLTGGGASIVRSATGQNFLVIEVPNANITEVERIIGDQGRVRVVAEYPVGTTNGTRQYETQTVIEKPDLTSISPARQANEGNPPNVGVTLTEPAAEEFARVMQEQGFTTEGQNNCRYDQNSDDPGWCLHTVVDDEIRNSLSMGDLADTIESGAFLETRSFQLTAANFTEAQGIKINLESGALPTTLDRQSQFSIEPSRAQKFKPLALLTGLAAWITVSGVIFYRYREIKVAVPMLLTAMAEVFLLLGFAAAIGLALDLSHIAGFIAVIGTGVDDLVIIADEILQRGEIKTGRVFRNRFRKAFWVIGAAAATTILAMSPLAFLSLGDLQGFAIVTIVGVLLGVLVTRPAYGDVLRNLLLDD